MLIDESLLLIKNLVLNLGTNARISRLLSFLQSPQMKMKIPETRDGLRTTLM